VLVASLFCFLWIYGNFDIFYFRYKIKILKELTVKIVGDYMSKKQIKLLFKDKDVREQYIIAINSYKLDKNKMDWITYLNQFEKLEERCGVTLNNYNDFLQTHYPGFFNN
jgi:hypothetical protein